MRYSILFCIFFYNTSPLKAADLSPPAWRDAPGSTFQEWKFRFDKSVGTGTPQADCSRLESRQATPWGHRGMPDRSNNPYQEKTGICIEFRTLWYFTRNIDWLPVYNGREGVWKLESARDFTNFLNFVIPGPGKDTGSTPVMHFLYLQIVYYSLVDPPAINIQYQPSIGQPVSTLPKLSEEQRNVLPEGWLHHSMTFTLTSCPRYESVFIHPPGEGEVYIDSVTIDTLCAGPGNKPATERPEAHHDLR